jgi:hypothetical protein
VPHTASITWNGINQFHASHQLFETNSPRLPAYNMT